MARYGKPGLVAGAFAAIGLVALGLAAYALGPTGHPKAKPENIVISVDKDGTIRWNGQIVTEDELEARLKNRRGKSPPD